MTAYEKQFRCPRCGESLADGGGELLCPGDHAYPVIDEIPRFVAGEDYVESFGRQWNHWATTQMDSVNGTTIFRDRFTRYFGAPEDLSGLRVLDAGCGVGAFIDVLSPHVSLAVGFDLSSAVEAARRNVGNRDNVVIAQADIFNPPFADASFDLVYSIGVLQHTPDPARAFASLARLVKPGGRLAVWVYERSHLEPLKPRHLLRRYTSHLGPDRGMRFVERYAPRALRARRAVARIGGGRLRKAIPVADPSDYAGEITEQLTDEQIAEWCLMDTHDMLVTTYDTPQTPETIARWFHSLGFAEPTRAAGAEGVAMIAERH